MKSNSIAFIGLCSEYCQTLERAANLQRREFIESMCRLLPRLYISATDLAPESLDPDAYIEPALDEDYYEAVRRGVETMMGEDDVYLEVFLEDMKYSDTPISASVSEGLADIFQSLYNFLSMVRDATDKQVQDALSAIRYDFTAYWSQPLCNTLRALNHLLATEDDDTL